MARITSTSLEDVCTFMTVCRWIRLRMRHVWEKNL